MLPECVYPYGMRHSLEEFGNDLQFPLCLIPDQHLVDVKDLLTHDLKV